MFDELKKCHKTAEFFNVPACGACSYLRALNGETFSEEREIIIQIYI
jgi:hypothetical protein